MKIKSFVKNNPSHKPDFLLIGLVVLLSLFGLLMVYNASMALGLRDFQDKYYFVKEQLKWFILGITVFLVSSKISIKKLKELAFPIFVITIVLLIMVFVPGLSVQALGARRWINFGIGVLQPAEVAKLAFIIYLSSWFTTKENNRMSAFLIILTIISGLVILEPDLGTAVVIIGSGTLLFFLSGARLSQFAVLIPVLIGAVILMGIMAPYRMQRILTFLDPERDPLGASYQINQALLAIGSGGFSGVGLGKSRQKFEYLPEAATDSIFAITAEEIGFIGSTLVVLIYLMLIMKIFSIGILSNNDFGRYLSYGIGAWIGIQTVGNLAAMMGLLPLTGIPLPLMSYGGSSLIFTLAALGLVTNISRSKKSYE